MKSSSPVWPELKTGPSRGIVSVKAQRPAGDYLPAQLQIAERGGAAVAGPTQGMRRGEGRTIIPERARNKKDFF